MRGYEETIREAELLASSPAWVVAYLKERAERLAADRIRDEGDEQMEKALLGLNDPLIDITLARYCRFPDTAKALFFREPANSSLSLAVLTNRIVGDTVSDFFLEDVFDSDKDRLCAYLAGASDDELYALFQNPKLDDSFLRDLLEGNQYWQALNDEKRLTIIAALHRNERMKMPYDDSFMDGYAEYSYGTVFDAAWKLAETAPITDKWARALRWLYDQMQPDAFSIKTPLELAARWFPQDDETIRRESESVEKGFLSSYQGVRKGLAKLALAKYAANAQTLLESCDIAFRSAAYAYADLTLEQIGSAHEKDGELAFQEMVHNRNLWKRADKRQALHAAAWSVVNNNKHSDLMAANIFNGIRENFAKTNPDWFRDEENFTPEPTDEPATKADIEALASRFSAPVAAYEQLKSALETINSRLGFVWWFSLGALVGVFSRYF